MIRLRQCIIALLIAIVLLCVVAGPVSGNDYPVEAATYINASEFQKFLNTTLPDSTITFGPGTYYLHDIEIVTDNLTFQSNQSTGGTALNTIIDGINASASSAQGIFYNSTLSGAYVNDITISHLTLQNGYSTDSNGGGAVDSYANVTVVSSDFYNDSAPGKYGGAINIHSNGVNLTVTGSDFTGCNANFGGALSGGNSAYIIINSSSFTNCSATNGGGAIYGSQGGSVTFCRFGNVISGDGSIVSKGLGLPLDVTDNWWGTNSPAASLAPGLTMTPFLEMGATATPVLISTSQSSTIQANFSYDNTGTLVANNILPDGIPVTFTVRSGEPAGSGFGTLITTPLTSLTSGHSVSTSFQSPAAGGSALINISVDGNNVTSLWVNVSPTVTGISPGSLLNTAAGQVSITGTGFDTTTGPTVSLGRAGYTNVPLVVSDFNATSVNATVPASLAAGAWTIVLINPDGQVASPTVTFQVLSLSPAPPNNGHNRNDYWVNTVSNEQGYQGQQPASVGVGPGLSGNQITPTETPIITPAVVVTQPVLIHAPTIFDMIVSVIQEYGVWLILIIVLIILIAILRRRWIREP